MNFIKKYLKYYLNFLAFLSPKLAGNRVFNLFQSVMLKKIKKREEEFYNMSTELSMPFEKEDLKYYVLDSAKSERIVFLIHGWNSNIGCMTLFAKELVKQNYKVIGFNLPGHGKQKRSKTNLVESRDAFIKLIEHVNPQLPISIIAHSFGSAVTSYVLPKLKYNVDKVVFLTSNNKLNDIFNHFKNMFGFNETVFNQFKLKVEKYVEEKVEDMVISKKINQSKFNKLLIIHDKFDKIIPFSDAININNEVKNSILIPFEKIGHYRMLWNENVVRKTLQFLNN
jgi:pimeloyl-ACP methyl ester carboxylesterase